MAAFNKKQAKQAVSAADKQAAASAKKQKQVEDKYLKKNLSVKKVGAVLDIDEYNDLKTQLGSDSAIADFAAGKGIKLDSAITSPKPTEEKPEGEPAVIPGFKPSEAEGLTPAVFDYEKALGLINAQGNIDTSIKNIEADANKYISDLQFGASKDIAGIQAGAAKDVASTQAGAVRYGADQELAGEGVKAGATRYIADRQLESDLGVENIRTKGAIDLQGIINAGAANVETIRGEYNVKGKKVDRGTAILGGLVSAFNF